MNELIFYSKCSTCRKAKKWLDEHDISYVAREIKEDPPGEDEIKKWLEISRRPIKSFFNTSGIQYRELNLKERLIDMPDAEKIALLASDPMLVKRPVLIIDEKQVMSGFKEQEWQEIF